MYIPLSEFQLIDVSFPPVSICCNKMGLGRAENMYIAGASNVSLLRMVSILVVIVVLVPIVIVVVLVLTVLVMLKYIYGRASYLISL